MTKRIAGLLFGVGMLVSTVGAFAGTQDFVAHNKTGVALHHMYVSPSSKDEWGEDILGEDVCAPNQDVTVTFADAEKADLWDLRIEDEAENSITWTGLKLNEISEVTLHWDGKKAWADVK
jgi:hypothetical protein